MSREMEQMFPRMSHEVEELFSPLNNSNLSDASLQLGSDLSPKCSLLVDPDECTQDCSASGFSKSCNTSSSQLPSLSETLEATTVTVTPTSTQNSLDEVTISLEERKILRARRRKAKQSIAFVQEEEKMAPTLETLEYFFPRYCSLPSFDCSTITAKTEPSHMPSPVHQFSSALRGSLWFENTQQQKSKCQPLQVFGSNLPESSTARQSSPLKEVTMETIGDNSKPYALPMVTGKIEDLKCIAPCTLAELLTHPQAFSVDDFCVVDCRYPFEYKGGHIQGAINIWLKSKLLEHFFSQPQYSAEKRHVIIFHCEFSSKRGPEMSRFMRRADRERNGMLSFPKLYYPELYLLSRGYKAFYQDYPELCEPQCYVKMLDTNNKEALKYFKFRSKSMT